MIFFESELCTNFAESTSDEWLETNGIGGFASSTISGANTRRYHGLLIAATKPPLGRLILLSKFEETLTIDGKSFNLSANQYPDSIYPEGYKYLKNFRLEPFPIWTFEVEGIEIEKSVFMIHGENATVIQYRIKKEGEKGEKEEREKSESGIWNLESGIKLDLKPLLAFRDYHHLRHEEADFNAGFEASENQVSIQPYAEMPGLFFSHNAGEIEKTGYWYRDFVYKIERERGFDFTEDLFQPFSLKFDLSETAVVIASTESQEFSKAAKFEKTEIKRREKLIKTAGANDDFTKQLVLAADQFIVKRGEGKTVIAGYHWFSDWGRDTMIALPGLTLATNRAEIAKDILLEFSNHISQGMIPNRFPDASETPEYNNVDGTLWYFEAVRAFVEKTEDYEFVRENLYEKLVEIIFWHLKGTRYNIHVDTDGLLCAGEAGTQLTWMDAKAGETVFTPRIGKPVEIQALWYNALCVMADFAERFGDKDGKNQYAQMAQIARQSFNRSFWNETEECLFDVVENGQRDFSVRPNQIFAVSLKNSMLDRVRARKVVEKVEAELLTPFGLRSLSPKNE
ncbi:MAG TPA: amylo-alpha-1,6-glucosidase, partial [Pyrinomonadaceae bacterium]|nr:amylo-alpha-1,6-glucosidase [Pyrinomonadaceae bacterium]